MLVYTHRDIINTQSARVLDVILGESEIFSTPLGERLSYHKYQECETSTPISSLSCTGHILNWNRMTA